MTSERSKRRDFLALVSKFKKSIKMWRTLKCDKICKKVLKIYNGKELNNRSKNCAKQIVWRELNRTVYLALVFSYLTKKNKTVKFVLTLS